MNYDWSKFSLKINIRANTSEVYSAWATPAKLEQWFLRNAHFIMHNGKSRDSTEMIVAGDKYKWNWHGHPDDIVEEGKIIAANGFDKIHFSFSGGAEVLVEIAELMNETIIKLTQEKIPTDEKGKVSYHMGCQTGWTFYLANLKSYLEGGIDLRNKNMAFTHMVNS